MTINGSDDRAPLESVSVRGQPRGRIVAVGGMVIVLLAAVVAVGLLGRGSADDSLGPSGSTAPGAALSVEPSRANSPSVAPSRSTPAASPRPSDTPRPSAGNSPALANGPLPGSPEIVLFQRDGDDVKVLGWRAGEPGIAKRQTVQGAARGINAQQTLLMFVSPDGAHLLVHASPATVDGPDTFRVYKLDGTGGREIWHSTSLGSGLSAGFAPTGQVLVTQLGLGRRDRGWTIVDLSGSKPVVHDVPLPPFPAPVPSASRDLRTLIINYAPLAMSADGRWVYAMSIQATEPQYRPAYRISVETGKAERIDGLPTTGSSRVVSPSVDLRSGRYLLSGPLATRGEGFVQAWLPGAKTPDFEAELGILFDAAWMVDGGVVVGEYDHLPGPFHFRVMTLTATGDIARTYFTAEGTNAGLVGVQDGFAAAYAAGIGAATGTRTLVVIRLSDGATSGVEVTDPDGVAFNLGIRP
jgi:hypothetical protein